MQTYDDKFDILKDLHSSIEIDSSPSNVQLYDHLVSRTPHWNQVFHVNPLPLAKVITAVTPFESSDPLERETLKGKEIEMAGLTTTPPLDPQGVEKGVSPPWLAHLHRTSPSFSE